MVTLELHKISLSGGTEDITTLFLIHMKQCIFHLGSTATVLQHVFNDVTLISHVGQLNHWENIFDFTKIVINPCLTIVNS